MLQKDLKIKPLELRFKTQCIHPHLNNFLKKFLEIFFTNNTLISSGSWGISKKIWFGSWI